LKLLLDQNLSHRILRRLETGFPASTQVRFLGLETADDATVWSVAAAGGYTIVTKDSDFHELSVMNGPPPKVIWLRCGNVPWDHVAELLMRQRDDIESFLTDDEVACLEIY
jgi:predicted nuclease of predicted toxin-antitoxin system